MCACGAFIAHSEYSLRFYFLEEKIENAERFCLSSSVPRVTFSKLTIVVFSFILKHWFLRKGECRSQSEWKQQYVFFLNFLLLIFVMALLVDANAFLQLYKLLHSKQTLSEHLSVFTDFNYIYTVVRDHPPCKV